MRAKFIALAAAAALALFALPSASTEAAPSTSSEVARVSAESAAFVAEFNDQNVSELRKFYTARGVLKLPNALAVSGRDNVANAWQQGFDAGLSQLTLNVSSVDPIGGRQVLENGTYALDINTPGGVITQTGTFSVLWRVPANPNRRPRIIFDAIDAD